MTRLAFTVIIAAAIAAVSAAGGGQTGAWPAGTVQVVDGDTIQVDGLVVDLSGIDAPEPGQRCYHAGFDWHCGLVAAYELRKRIALSGRDLICTPDIGTAAARDGDAPVRAECWVGDSSLASAQLRSGMGVIAADAPERLVHDEAFARGAGLGIWGGRFVPPADWRAGVRLDGGGPVIERDCVLIGYSGLDGRPDRYLSILDPDYESGLADLETGLAVRLCSDEAARAAGWHR